MFFVGFQCLRQVNGNLNNAWHDNFIPPSAARQHAKWYVTMRLRVCGLRHHLVQATVQSLEVALNPLIDAQSSPLNVGDRHVKGKIYTYNAWKAFKQFIQNIDMTIKKHQTNCQSFGKVTKARGLSSKKLSSILASSTRELLSRPSKASSRIKRLGLRFSQPFQWELWIALTNCDQKTAQEILEKLIMGNKARKDKLTFYQGQWSLSVWSSYTGV